MREREDLSEVERRLVDGAFRGDVVDGAPTGTTPDDVGAVTDWELRVIRAELLALMITGEDADHRCHRRRGLRLRGALITGPLDLAHGNVEHPIVFEACRFGSPVDLTGARVGPVTLRGCDLPALLADEIECSRSVDLGRSIVTSGPVWLRSASIRGELKLTGAKLQGTEEHGCSCVADRLHAGAVLLNGGFEAAGCVRLDGASIDNQLDMGGAHLTGTDERGNALRAVRMRVGTEAFLSGGFEAAGALRLRGARIDGNLDLDGAKLTSADDGGNSLVGDHFTVGGRARLRKGFAAAGTIRFWGARFGAELGLRGAKLAGRDRNGDALVADELHVAAEILMTEGFEASGAVRLQGARIEGNLDLEGAKLTGTNADGNSFVGDGLSVGGGVRLRRGFEAAGTVRLWGGHIGGQLGMQGAKLVAGDAHGDALVADQLHVGANVLMNEGFEAAGAVGLRGTRIEGNLELTGATLAGTDTFGNALRADRLQVRGNVLMRDGYEANGETRLVGAQIDGHLALARARRLGRLALQSARCGSFRHDRDSWPQPGDLVLRGFRFGALAGDLDWRQRVDWARRQELDYWSPDPYEQLAQYYAGIGDESAARRVRIARYDDELHHLRTVRKRGSLAYRFWRLPFGWLVGYGYRRWPAGALLVLTLLTAAVMFRLADDAEAMTPNPQVDETSGELGPCGAAYPCFNAAVYGADVVLPIIDFGQDSAWRPDESTAWGRWAAAARWAFIALGWVLASVFAAAFTRLVQRE